MILPKKAPMPLTFSATPLHKQLGAAALAVTVSFGMISLPAEAGVIQATQCVDGVGSSCDELAGGNDLIKRLQKRSEENRERYAQEALDTYNERNFGDYFSVVGKKMARHKDGTYEVIDIVTYSKLEQAGKIDKGKFIE
ncbi:unnamed protein product [Heterosigma akashiwo]